MIQFLQISNGGNIYLEYLFDAENYTDFIYRYEVVKQLTNYNSGLIDELENLILAENIRESAFFQSTIGSVLNSLLSFDTTKYDTLTGHLTFDNGITQINPITTRGDVMATYIFGNFDLLKIY